MIIYLPERIYNVIREDERIQELSKALSDTWGVGFPSLEKHKEINRLGFRYMVRAYHLLKPYPELYKQLLVINRENMTFFVMNTLQETSDIETKLECLYRLISSWICGDNGTEFIETFESATKEQLYNLSANVVKAYFIIKTSEIDSIDINDFIKQSRDVYEYIKQNCHMTTSLEKMLVVETIDQTVIHVKNSLLNKDIDLITADTIIQNMIYDVSCRLTSINSTYILLNTRLLYYYILRIHVLYANSCMKEIPSAIDKAFQYLEACLIHKADFTRSLYTHNEFMFSHLVVLMNGLYMIVDSEQQEKLRNLLSETERSYLVGLSNKCRLSHFIVEELYEILDFDFGVSVVKYYEDEIYHLIEPILIRKQMEG